MKFRKKQIGCSKRKNIYKGGDTHAFTGASTGASTGALLAKPNPHLSFTGGQVESSGHYAFTKGGRKQTRKRGAIKQSGMKRGGMQDIEYVNRTANRGLNGGGALVPCPLPGPEAWSSSPSSWPSYAGGENGVNFSLNNYHNQPDTQHVTNERSYTGGARKSNRRTKRRKHNKRGGNSGAGVSGFIPQLGNRISNVWATWNAQPPYPSVLPYQDQFSK